MQTNQELLLRDIWDDSRGATAIEYGLIVALIAIAIITALQGLGNEVGATMSGIETKMAQGNAAV